MKLQILASALVASLSAMKANAAIAVGVYDGWNVAWEEGQPSNFHERICRNPQENPCDYGFWIGGTLYNLRGCGGPLWLSWQRNGGAESGNLDCNWAPWDSSYGLKRTYLCQ